MNDHSNVGSGTPSYCKSVSDDKKFQVEKFLPAKERPLRLNDIEILESNEFKVALERDIKGIQSSPHIDETNLFHSINIPYRYLWAKCYSVAIEAWEKLFKAIKEIDENRFLTMHKGTLYYFCGISAFYGNDYERAVFYFDAALHEDIQNYEKLFGENPRDVLHAYNKAPAALFLKLDDSRPEQTAIELTKKTKKLMDDSLNRYSAGVNSNFNLTHLRSKFLKPSLLPENATWRSAVTALLSYMLEGEVRLNEYSLRSKHGGTMEPFFIHLFKGCLLFETILKISPAFEAFEKNLTEKNLTEKKKRITLTSILNGKSSILEALNLSADYKNSANGIDFDEILNLNASWRKDRTSFNDRVVWTAYGIRNTTGHKLTWKAELGAENYRELSEDILFAIFLAIEKCFKR